MIVPAWVNVWKGSVIFPNTPTTTTTTSNNNKLRFRPWWVFGRLAWWSWTLWIPMSQRQWPLAPRWMTLIANTSVRRARNTRWLVAAGSDDSLFLELFERMWICDIWDFLPVRVSCEQNHRIYRDIQYSYRENLGQYNMASLWTWDFCLQVAMILFPKKCLWDAAWEAIGWQKPNQLGFNGRFLVFEVNNRHERTRMCTTQEH